MSETWCIHDPCKSRDKAQGPSVIKSTPWTAVSSQMNYMHIWTAPTTIKRRVTIPARMACAWNPHVAIVDIWKCSSNLEKGYRGWRLQTLSVHWKWWRQVRRQAVSTLTQPRWVRSWKWNGCFTLLNRITKLKNVNSEPSRCFALLLRQAFPKGFIPPWRIQHESHTCSEQSLRSLMWNATDMQKHQQ